MALTIRLKRNGPYLISAEEASAIQIVDADGNTCIPEANRSIALCRCGGSSTKPFCDGTHKRNGFGGGSGSGQRAAGSEPATPDPGAGAGS